MDKDRRDESRVYVDLMPKSMREVEIKKFFKKKIKGEIINISKSGICINVHVESEEEFIYKIGDVVSLSISLTRKKQKASIRNIKEKDTNKLKIGLAFKNLNKPIHYQEVLKKWILVQEQNHNKKAKKKKEDKKVNNNKKKINKKK